MHNQTKKQITKHIISNRGAIRNPASKIVNNINPDLLVDISRHEKEEIDLLLSDLKLYFDDLFPFLRNIKNSIKDITEETHLCAIYLTLSTAFYNWSAFFLLVANTKHAAAGGLLRQIKEAIMQVNLFVIENADNSRFHLDKWYKGEIITHGAGRESVSAEYNRFMTENRVDLKSLETHLYQVESQVAHNAYATMLESINPITEDFEFDGPTCVHRTLSYLNYAKGSFASMNIAMKAVFLKSLHNEDIYNQLENILIKYNPEISETLDEKVLNGFINS
jgi:hypothetical protein